jgi:hypothetical protein
VTAIILSPSCEETAAGTTNKPGRGFMRCETIGSNAIVTLGLAALCSARVGSMLLPTLMIASTASAGSLSRNPGSSAAATSMASRCVADTRGLRTCGDLEANATPISCSVVRLFAVCWRLCFSARCRFLSRVWLCVCWAIAFGGRVPVPVAFRGGPGPY